MRIGQKNVLLLTCWLSLSGWTYGQQTSEPQAGEDFKISATVDLVVLDVSVKDKQGGFVSGLNKDDFKVFENGKLQTVTQFSNKDQPVTVGLVIDNSGSMAPKRPEVITAAL